MMSSVYADSLIFSQNICKRPQEVPFGVLVGKIGVGKSTLFNKITSSSVAAEEGGTSLTRNVFSSSSSYGEKFFLLDTPGTQSDSDKLQDGINLRLALTERPISRIFVLIQYASRPALMVREFNGYLEFLSEWKQLITIVVTHWDRDDDPKGRELFEQTKKALMDNCCNLPNSFIFSGKSALPVQLCKAFFEQLCLTPPTKLLIDDNYFFKKFDIYDNLNKQVKEYINKFQEIKVKMLKEIENYSEESSKDEFYHACIVQVQLISEEILEDFYKQFGLNMTQYDNYMHFLQLKREFYPGIESVRKIAQKKMSYQLLDASHPKNSIKQCPFCKIYWVKIEGCDGQTICGNRLSPEFQKDSLQLRGYFLRFKFFWKSDFSWEKEKENISSPSFLAMQQSLRKGIGCGGPFIWAQLPPISDSKLSELKEAGLGEFLSGYEKEGKQLFDTYFEKISKEAKIAHI